MEYKVGVALGLSIAMGLAALGVGLGLGRAVGSAMEALGRQPDAMTKILVVMLTGCALIEAVVFYILFLGPSIVKG